MARLQAASKGWDRLNNGQRRVQDALKQGDLQLSEDSTPAMTANLIETLDQYRMRFVSAMNDDFNTPLALGALQDMTTDVNRWLDKGIAAPEVLEQIANIYKELAGDVLGVVRDQAATSDAGSAEREAALIEMMIQMRADARKAKDFARADRDPQAPDRDRCHARRRAEGHKLEDRLRIIHHRESQSARRRKT